MVSVNGVAFGLVVVEEPVVMAIFYSRSRSKSFGYGLLNGKRQKIFDPIQFIFCDWAIGARIL